MIEPQPAKLPPDRRPLQFTLQTLLLLFVVLASSLAVFKTGGIVVFFLVVGLAIVIHCAKSLWSLVYVALAVLVLMCLLLPAIQSAKESARRTQCLNNLKQIILALHNYHSVNGCFPPAYVADARGKPMHSWRVLIRPYLEYDNLYKAYKFAEPWDGPNNKKLFATLPSMYTCPSDPASHAPGTAKTNYVAVVGRNAAWAGEKSRKLDTDFAENASRTIMLVEVADSDIAWTEPRDFSLDAVERGETKSPAVSSKHGGREDFFFIYGSSPRINVAMADGSVHHLPSGFPAADLPKILQIGAYREDDIERSVALNQRLNWPNIGSLALWLLSVGTLLTRAVKSRKTREVPCSGPPDSRPPIAGQYNLPLDC